MTATPDFKVLIVVSVHARRNTVAVALSIETPVNVNVLRDIREINANTRIRRSFAPERRAKMVLFARIRAVVNATMDGLDRTVIFRILNCCVKILRATMANWFIRVVVNAHLASKVLDVPVATVRKQVPTEVRLNVNGEHWMRTATVFAGQHTRVRRVVNAIVRVIRVSMVSMMNFATVFVIVASQEVTALVAIAAALVANLDQSILILANVNAILASLVAHASSLKIRPTRANLWNITIVLTALTLTGLDISVSRRPANVRCRLLRCA